MFSDTKDTRRWVKWVMAVLAVLPAFAFSASATQAKIPPYNTMYYTYSFDKSTLEGWKGNDFKINVSTSDDVILKLALEKDMNGFAQIRNRGSKVAYMSTRIIADGEWLDLSFATKDVLNGGRLAPVVYVGHDEPRSPWDFVRVGDLPGAKWSKTESTFALPVSSEMLPTVVVAIGFLNLDDVLKSQYAGIDNIAITVGGR